MNSRNIAFIICLLLSVKSNPQTIQDNFEGTGNITTWVGDNCGLNPNLGNPIKTTINTSDSVLEYHDIDGQYANIRFDVGRNLNLSNSSTFSIKIFIPSNGLTGNSPNQISLKLQDGNLSAPWSTQSEIIKPVVLNQWQTITFDFASDPYHNLNNSSAPPTQRNDFNRVLLQVNGENNNDHVRAYIDDFYYFDSTIISTPTNLPVYNRLVWSDEFNTNGPIDNSKWFHQTQLPNGSSWYNGEIQHYTNRTANSVVNNGELNLIAKKETYTNQGHTKQYTSARLNSKFAFTYGKVEVRAKLPTGIGTWPAIWMLGKNISETGAFWQTQGFGNTSWPACGEIDIMEHWGTNQNFIQSAMHTPSSFGNTMNHGGQSIPTASTAYHIYTLEWYPDRMIFSIDNVVHFTYQPQVRNSSTWPFDQDQYILFNIAIQPSITSTFIQSSMDVDYIRIFQETPVGLGSTTSHEQFNIFPNPVKGILNINFGYSLNQMVDVKILNISGKLVLDESINFINGKAVLNNLDSLEKGVYILTFITNEQVYSHKFLK